MIERKKKRNATIQMVYKNGWNVCCDVDGEKVINCWAADLQLKFIASKVWQLKSHYRNANENDCKVNKNDLSTSESGGTQVLVQS